MVQHSQMVAFKHWLVLATCSLTAIYFMPNKVNNNLFLTPLKPYISPIVNGSTLKVADLCLPMLND